jgi:hypothetical protein
MEGRGGREAQGVADPKKVDFFISKRTRLLVGSMYVDQGCQMVCFQTKNPNLGKFWRVLQRTLGPFYGLLLYFMDTW